jgi:hypothetical protein
MKSVKRGSYGNEVDMEVSWMEGGWKGGDLLWRKGSEGPLTR